MSTRQVRADDLRQSDIGKKVTVTSGVVTVTAPIRYIALHRTSISVNLQIKERGPGADMGLSLEAHETLTIHDDDPEQE